MAYKRSFRHLRTHLLVDEPLRHELEADRAAVFGALRAGHAFLAVDSVAPAHGLSVLGRGRRRGADDGRRGAAPATGRCAARLPAPARVRLMRDGAEVATANGTSLEHRAEGPGVYRVEAYRDARGRERTWVLSNPIYLR